MDLRINSDGVSEVDFVRLKDLGSDKRVQIAQVGRTKP